jgi:hypothetical protein
LKNLRFFLLGLGEKSTPHGSEIWLWGIGDHAKNALVVNRSFRPYLYPIPKGDSAPHDLRRSARGSMKRTPVL